MNRKATPQKEKSASVFQRQLEDRTAELDETLVTLLREVSERKRIEAALREINQLLNAIVEGTTDSVFIRNLDGRYSMINGAGARLIGRPAEEIVGKSIADFFPSEIVASIAEQDREVLAANETRTFEIALPTPDGTGSFLATRGPHRDAQGRVVGVFGITRDITELRRIEHALSEISDREQQRIGQDLHDGICQRLAGIGLLAGVLKSKLAAKSLGETADAAEIARLLEETTAEARSVARGLFHLHPGPHGLMISLYELAESTQRLFKTSCSLQCEEPVFVEDSATSAHLYRIAQEAVNNAVKHSGCSRIGIVLGESGGTISLAMHDDGKGIHQPRNASRGLGMHIMNYRARMIGGAVEVRSGSQGGTSVICFVSRKPKQQS